MSSSHDKDWISRRWQGEGNVVAPASPRPEDPDKRARIAEQQKHTDISGNVGRHCDHAECNALDYLPTKCDGCGKFHCHEHATQSNHDCRHRKGPVEDRRAPACMLCSRAIHVRTDEGESIDRAMDRHIESGCQSGLADKVRTQRAAMNRCAYGKGKRRCKDTAYHMRFGCQGCDQKFCLKHRDALDHVCEPLSMGRTLGEKPGGLVVKVGA